MTIQQTYLAKLSKMQQDAKLKYDEANREDNGFLGKASNAVGNTINIEGNQAYYKNAYTTFDTEIKTAKAEISAASTQHPNRN